MRMTVTFFRGNKPVEHLLYREKNCKGFPLFYRELSEVMTAEDRSSRTNGNRSRFLIRTDARSDGKMQVITEFLQNYGCNPGQNPLY